MKAPDYAEQNITVEPPKVKRKRGEVREDGMMFWNKLVNGNDHWVTPARFLEKREKVNALAREARLRNPEKHRSQNKRWKSQNKEKLRQRRAVIALSKPRKPKKPPLPAEEKARRIKLSAAKFREANRVRLVKEKREKRHLNREREARLSRERRAKRVEIERQKIKDRRKNDPKFDMACRLRGRIAKVLMKREFPKNGKTQDIVGCGWDEFCVHMESFFNDEINWNTRSSWHLDHIIPLSSASTLEELVRLCHYTNLRPLLAVLNLRKSDKMPDEL